MSEYDKVTQASMNSLYVKAQQLDRGHNERDAPPVCSPGRGIADAIHMPDAMAYASDAGAYAPDATTHASDAKSRVSDDSSYAADKVTHASDAGTHAAGRLLNGFPEDSWPDRDL